MHKRRKIGLKKCKHDREIRLKKCNIGALVMNDMQKKRESKFRWWENQCKAFGDEIWRLAGEENTEEGVFMTKTPYMMNGKQYYGKPHYHVWWRAHWYTYMKCDEAFRQWIELNGEV